MAVSNAGSNVGGVAQVIDSATALAQAVGPGWGLLFLVVILLFLPKWGVVVHLARLWKEDRADARKRRVEADRLEAKFRNRPKELKDGQPVGRIGIKR